MATRKATDAADDVADAVTAAGRRAGSKARAAGARAGAAFEETTQAGATKVRRAARRGVSAYDDAAREFDGQVNSIEDQIRQNPIAAAGAALLIGVVLGRFVL